MDKIQHSNKYAYKKEFIMILCIGVIGFFLKKIALEKRAFICNIYMYSFLEGVRNEE